LEGIGGEELFEDEGSKIPPKPILISHPKVGGFYIWT
jgi:hypothetical protein